MVSLRQADALTKALHQAPAARPAAVARATGLINDAQYPSPSTIQAIADRLAANLDGPSQ